MEYKICFTIIILLIIQYILPMCLDSRIRYLEHWIRCLETSTTYLKNQIDMTFFLDTLLCHFLEPKSLSRQLDKVPKMLAKASGSFDNLSRKLDNMFGQLNRCVLLSRHHVESYSKRKMLFGQLDLVSKQLGHGVWIVGHIVEQFFHTCLIKI